MKWQKQVCHVGRDKQGYARAIVLKESDDDTSWLALVESKAGRYEPTLRGAKHYAGADEKEKT